MKEWLKDHVAPHLLVVILFACVGYVVTLAIDIRHLKQDIEVLSDAGGIIERLEKLESKKVGQVAYAQLSSAKTQRYTTSAPVILIPELMIVR
jgi:hypothetical protein